MPGRFELKPTLAKIWHAPDNFRIMEPLPPMHRRGIIIAAIVLVIGFLLPASETSDSPVVTREAQLDLQSQSQPPTEAQLQAQLVAAAKRSGSGGARCAGTYPGRPAGRTKPAANAAFPAG